MAIERNHYEHLERGVGDGFGHEGPWPSKGSGRGRGRFGFNILHARVQEIEDYPIFKLMDLSCL